MASKPPSVWEGGSLGNRAHTAPSLEEIEKKLNVYHKGAKIWKMLIFCQVGLGLWVGAGWGQ